MGKHLGQRKWVREVVRMRGRSETSQSHRKPTTQMPLFPKPNHLRNRLDTTPAPPVFPPQTDNFYKPIKFKSVLGNEFFGKQGEKPSEEKPEPKENPKLKP
jgi:hypothetical protein